MNGQNPKRSSGVATMTGGLVALLLAPGVRAAAPELAIEGRVRLSSGQAASGVQVRLFDLADLNRSLGVATDEAGYFSLAAPRPAGETDAVPRRVELFQNYPNPFNPATIIPYQLPRGDHVSLEVFNLLGQRVATLVDEEQAAGRHTAVWNGTDAAGRPVAAGIYFYRLRGSRTSHTRPMVLLDGPVAVPGAASAPGVSERLEAPGRVYGLTVSGPGVVTHAEADVRAGPWPMEIVVEAEARGELAMKVVASGSRILGDVDANGRVDILDAILVALYSIDPATLLPNNGDISLGDVNRDGLIDVTDVYLIATYSVDPGDPTLPDGIGEPVQPVLETKMYWLAHGPKIQRANLDGSQLEDLVTTGLESPSDLALDVSRGKMYWVDEYADKVQRANLDGSQVEDFVTGSRYASTLALDLAEGKMYWGGAYRGRAKIQRATLDGSRIEEFHAVGFRNPKGLNLDIAGGKMYWYASIVGGAKIERANLDLSRVEALVTSGLYSGDLALDLAGSKMYMTSSLSDKIFRSNLDGSQFEELLDRFPENVESIALVSAREEMYWTEGGKIFRSHLDGSWVQEVLDTGGRYLGGLVIDTTGLPTVTVNRPPVLDGIGRQSIEEGESLRIGLVARDPEGSRITFQVSSGNPGTATVSLPSVDELELTPVTPGEAKITLTASDNSGVSTQRSFIVHVTEPVPESQGKMYWTDSRTDKIQRSNLDGSQIEDLVVTGLDIPRGLVLDVTGGKMYWVDSGTHKIQRANLDGSGVEDLATSQPGWLRTLALDIPGQKMFWTDDGVIMRANLGGSQAEVFLEGGDPSGLALDPDGGKIYWTDIGGSRIWRMNLDGTHIGKIFGGLNIPRGLALDLAGGKVYWADPGTVRIQRGNLDGGHRPEDLILYGLERLTIGLALDLRQGKMYWTDMETGKIQRANLDGTRMEDLVTGLREPQGLALDIVVPPTPDLAALSPSVYPPDTVPGQSFVFSVAIQNRGNAPAPATNLGFYRSTDSTITGDDTKVGTRPLRGLSAPGTSFKLIRLRAPPTRGTYHYGACVEGVEGEVDFGNNCSPAAELVVR